MQDTLNYAKNTNTKVAITFPINRYPNIYDNTKQYTIDDLLEAIKKKINELNEKNKFVRIVYTGEVLGPGMSTKSNTPLKKIIFDSTVNKKITIDGEGLDSYSIIYSSDYVYGLVKANFSKSTENSILANNERISTMSFAYKIIEHNPTVKNIEFEEKTKTEFNEIFEPEEQCEIFTPRFEIDEIVQRTNSYAHTIAQKKKIDKAEPVISKSTPNKIEETVQEEYTPLGKFLLFLKNKFGLKLIKEKESVKNSWNHYINNKKRLITTLIFSIIIAILFYFVLLPVVVIGWESNRAYHALKSYQTLALTPDNNAQKHVETIYNANKNIQRAWRILSWTEVLPLVGEYYAEIDKCILSMDLSSKAINDLEKIRVPLISYLNEINIAEPLNGTLTSTRTYTAELELINDNLPYLRTATQSLFQATEILETVDSTIFPQVISTKLDNVKSIISENSQYIETGYLLISELSDIVGKDEQKTYIILIHNPYELRPHGGWISGYGVLKFRHGQIISLSFENIYNLDGIIKNNSLWFNLPTDLAKFSDYPNQSWTPSTINWEQDYSKVHIELEKMFKSMGISQSIDGVISVNLFTLQEILKLTGPVYISSISQSVSSDNLMEIVNQYHTNFEPSTDNKADILTQIAEQVYIKIADNNEVSSVEIFDLLKNQLEQKNIVISMKNNVIQNEINRLYKNINLQTNSNEFFIYPLEWNNGGNKANAFVNRAITVNLDSSTATTGVINIDYLNKSTKDVYPEGEYIAFVRIYFPANTNITQVLGTSEYWTEKLIILPFYISS